MKVITAINTTEHSVFIDDLGTSVPSNASLELSTYYTEEEIRNSFNLAKLVRKGELRIEGLEPEQKIWSTLRRR